MVWPILISVAVTPRISPDVEAAGHIRTASAPTAPNPVTKRIDTPPLFIGTLKRRPRQARLGRARRWKHAMTGGSTPIVIMMD
jgi:hypothetical protein